MARMNKREVVKKIQMVIAGDSINTTLLIKKQKGWIIELSNKKYDDAELSSNEVVFYTTYNYLTLSECSELLNSNL